MKRFPADYTGKRKNNDYFKSTYDFSFKIVTKGSGYAENQLVNTAEKAKSQHTHKTEDQ